MTQSSKEIICVFIVTLVDERKNQWQLVDQAFKKQSGTLPEKIHHSKCMRSVKSVSPMEMSNEHKEEKTRDYALFFFKRWYSDVKRRKILAPLHLIILLDLPRDMQDFGRLTDTMGKCECVSPNRPNVALHVCVSHISWWDSQAWDKGPMPQNHVHFVNEKKAFGATFGP